jgi:hypothetical protein
MVPACVAPRATGAVVKSAKAAVMEARVLRPSLDLQLRDNRVPALLVLVCREKSVFAQALQAIEAGLHGLVHAG